jgi:hypothetical protein
VSLSVVLATDHLLRANLGLLALGRGESRARHHGRADGGGRAEGGPREGTEDAGVHGGLSIAGQRAAAGSNWGGRGSETHWTRFVGPCEMSGDGVAG